MPPHGAGQLIVGQCSVQPNSRGEALLVRVTGPHQDDRRCRAPPADARWLRRGCHQEAEGPCADDRHDVTCRDGSAEHSVHGAGHRLHGDGVSVAQLFGHLVELARVGHEAGCRPATAGIGAEARLQPRPDVAEGEVAAVPEFPA